MNQETGTRILAALDVISIEVAATRNDIRGVDAKFTNRFDGIDAKTRSFGA